MHRHRAEMRATDEFFAGIEWRESLSTPEKRYAFSRRARLVDGLRRTFRSRHLRARCPAAERVRRSVRADDSRQRDLHTRNRLHPALQRDGPGDEGAPATLSVVLTRSSAAPDQRSPAPDRVAGLRHVRGGEGQSKSMTGRKVTPSRPPGAPRPGPRPHCAAMSWYSEVSPDGSMP